MSSMQDIIRVYPSYTTEVDRSALDAIREAITIDYMSIEGALLSVGIDPRYYNHWVSLAKSGDDKARSLIYFIDSCLEFRLGYLKKRVANGRDNKAVMALVENLEIEKQGKPRLDETERQDNMLYITEDW